MEISKNLAYQIILNIKDIVNQDLNFMDKKGFIIASTDPDRVNTFHEAAKLCVDSKRAVVIEYDNQYRGTKKGINIPVEFEDEIIGVVGITGDRSEVEKYGIIIKKMTEILLKEEWIKENEIQRRDNYRNLLEGIIYSSFEDTSVVISIEESLAKYIAVSKSPQIFEDKEKMDRVLNILDSYLYNNNNVIYSYIFQELIILFVNSNKYFVERILNDVNKTYYNIFNEHIDFGISPLFYDISKANMHFNQALSSYKWQTEYENKDDNMLFYDDMDLGILLTNISYENKEKFSEKILEGLTKDDLVFYSNLLNLYGKHNGSINSISEELFMHKNTIQYRLNRLNELTGYNPREYNGYVILKLAFLLHNDNLV